MFLYDVLYGSLEVIKFDIKLVVLYFFERMKCIVHYLGLSLIDILACGML